MDSELQMGLIGAGVAAFVAIVAYNKWQERKHRRQAEKAFKSDHRDVLLEPGEAPAEARKADRKEPGEREPVIGDTAPSFAAAAPRRVLPDLPEVLDERADCIIRIEAIEPLDAPKLWEAQRGALDGLSKTVRWFAFDDAANLWQPLNAHSAGTHHWFCAALQLVDRRGPIGEADYLRFSGGVQRVAEQFLAVPAGLPSRTEALGNATELDRFCADVDVQIGINVVTANGQPFAGTKIRGLAEVEGLVLNGDGAFHAVDEEGKSLFTLCNMEPGLFVQDEMRHLQTSGLTLVIDVPCVANGATVFERMMTFANQLAGALNGVVVDDNRAAFGPDAAGLIKAQILQFQDHMASQRIPAGGPLARRLFSA
ncbi:cell division protein ZipA C-terminal FtsZ-binding domain-containing protein [Parazoarcus communis]|uniref:Cell division protein ZipA n=1 Tax=Parazoarcus communis SWub3 = DSM 12120 TaxID=1121029 RepID=A0A323UW49_9RHOO|nr:cell division protein ZipA C-terminal FtsZ-binding domain-containing protein [Parazoarcus communis]NMG71449.1 ZipA [Parazoarcus communis SWub3 = DSM 12120]PZA15910.1 ZipA [Azoarcus communis] [Parazoarcus communis SWub3 = DSM 12120]